MPDTAAILACALAEVPHLFDRGGPVRLSPDPSCGTFTVEVLTAPGVVTEAHQVRRPYELMKCGHALVRREITLPDRVARLYLDHRAGWCLRPLHGITSAPLLHADGAIRAEEGYDPETRLWCERVPPLTVPDRPMREEAESALRRLRQHFRSFAFADAARVTLPGATTSVVDRHESPGADESAFLCALLTAVCRPCLPLAPALLICAPQYSGAGTGKGLLVRAICAIAFGKHPAAITAGGTPEELEKRIGSALMDARPTLFLDNVNGTALKSDLLASAIAENPAEIRPLGQSKTVRLNSTAWICVTGNGLTLSEDLTRRFLTVKLDAGVEDPEARDFRTDFVAETQAARAQLLTDLLSIWRWGRQQSERLQHGRPMGSFPDWARWCRDPLLALGCKDPALRIAEAKAQDPRRQEVVEIFRAWWKEHGEQPVKLAELSATVCAAVDPKGPSRQRLANTIGNLVRTQMAGFCLERIPSAKWSPDAYVLRRLSVDTVGEETH